MIEKAHACLDLVAPQDAPMMSGKGAASINDGLFTRIFLLVEQQGPQIADVFTYDALQIVS